MSIRLKTPEEIEKIRTAGLLACEVLDLIEPHVVAGVSTDELNEICHRHIVEVQQATPAPLNYRGFPKSICTSINHQICHGIPSDKRLKKGDIVNIDITVIKDGCYGDTSRMYYVGTPSPSAKRLCDIAYQCLVKGIEVVRPGATTGDIGHAIQQHAEDNHYSIVREYCGHGTGLAFHEEPQILHYGKPGSGTRLEPGMTFTIEPMVNQGKRHTRLLADQWTVVTRDRSLSAQWEHTLAVTDDGYDILTLPSDRSL